MRDIHCYSRHSLLYANPYMVVTPRGYTKHYYNGSQRIAARLGDYWAASIADEPGMVAYAREVLEQTMNSEDGEEFYLEPFTLYMHYMTCSYSEDMLHEALNGGARLADHIGGIDRGIFYYHPDHLGSSSWITDDRGQVVQYLHYMPFGELWENQQISEYDERFKFTGKERDTETGYDYFGARYYASTLPMWLSVDPLADKYPGINPYAYCAWNPMKYVDPDGREITITGEDGVTVTYVPNGEYKGNDNFIKNTYEKLNHLNRMFTNTDFMSSIVQSSSIFNITPNESNVEGTHSYKNGVINIGTNCSIDGIGHELFHSYQDIKGQGGPSIHNEVEAYLFQTKIVFMSTNGMGSTPLTAAENKSSKLFSDAINTLLYMNFDQKAFNTVVDGFKVESNANLYRVYDKYPLIRSNQTKSLIKQFYPIYP